MFEYEFSKCRVIVAHSGTSEPDLTLIKLRFRPEFIEASPLVESEKLKLLTYFLKTLRSHSLPSFRVLAGLSEGTTDQLSCLFRPRYELFGASYFNFLLSEGSQIDDKVFAALQEFDQMHNNYRVAAFAQS